MSDSPETTIDTEPADPPTTDMPPAADPETDTEPDGTDTDTEGGRASRQAARYRTELRDAQQALDAANARIETMQRAEVARLAAERLAVGADLLDIGNHALSDLLDDDGDIDSGAVDAAVAELIADRPGLAKPALPKGPSLVAHGPGHGGGPGGTWSDVIQQPGKWQ